MPYEERSRLSFDVWSPSEKKVRHVNDQGKQVRPFELEETNVEFVEKDTKQNLAVDFLGTNLGFQIKNEHPVLLMIRVYARQPSTVDPEYTQTIQHIGDVCITTEDFAVGTLIDKEVYCPAENRNQSKIQRNAIQHTVFEIKSSCTFKTIGSFKAEIGEKLNCVYEEVIKHDISRALGLRNLNLIAPISLPPTGAPLNKYETQTTFTDVLTGTEDIIGFNRCKGMNTQAYWRTRPNIVSDQWLIRRLKESLETRGETIESFSAFFTDNAGFDFDSSEFKHYATDVIRVSTMHAATRPYIPDCKWRTENKNGIQTNESYGIDDYNIASVIPGDCEDGAGLATSILWCIIEENWFKQDGKMDTVLKLMSRIIKFVGIPFGANGFGKNPYDKDITEKCGHSFGLIVPFHIFLKWRGETREEISRITGNYEKRNGFGIGSTKEMQHVCVLETTILTTSFYHTRLDFPMIGKLQKVLLEKYDEDRLMWKNYHIQEAMSLEHVAHCEVNRIFCPILSLFYDKKTDFSNLNLETNQTFSLSTRGGILPVRSEHMFSHHDDACDEIVASVPVKISIKAHEADCFFIDNFDRPVVPLCAKKEEGVDLFRFDNKKSRQIYNSAIFKEKYKYDAVLVSKNKRINLFCWKLSVEGTDDVINTLRSTLKDEIGCKDVIVCCRQFGNGFCFTFVIL